LKTYAQDCFLFFFLFLRDRNTEVIIANNTFTIRGAGRDATGHLFGGLNRTLRSGVYVSFSRVLTHLLLLSCTRSKHPDILLHKSALINGLLREKGLVTSTSLALVVILQNPWTPRRKVQPQPFFGAQHARRPRTLVSTRFPGGWG
jgi:hypothetical protein